MHGDQNTDDFEKAKALFISGTLALEQGDLELAEIQLIECLRLIPDRESTRHNLAFLHVTKADRFVEQQRFDDALVSYDNAIRFNHELFSAWVNKGLLLNNQLQRSEEAIPCFVRATELEPNDADLQNALGVAYTRANRYQEAILCFDRALLKNPEFAQAWNNRGVILNNLNRYAESLANCSRAVEISPGLAEGWYNRGIALSELKRAELALESYDRAVTLKPDYAEAWTGRGVVLNRLKRHQEALVSCNCAVSLKPDLAEARSNLGIVLHDLKRLSEALDSYAQAIAINPRLAAAWSNRGNALKELKRHTEALESYDHALALKPDYVEAWSNRGIVLNDLRCHEEALLSYDHAIALKADYAEVWSNRGIALYELGRHQEAFNSYQRAIEISPESAEAWNNRGHVLRELNRQEEALSSYQRALELKPEGDFWLGDLVHAKMKICDWADLHFHISALEQRIREGKKTSDPFAIIGLFDCPEIQKTAAEIFVNERLQPTKALGIIVRRPRRERIRVGYFSMDFRDHPVSQLIAELFDLHDQSRFEIYGFSFGVNTRDAMRQRLENAFIKFLDVRHLSDIEIAKLSRETEIDIAVDLGGHTQDSRPQIFAERAAPLQVNYLGYPGTWGGDCMDYFIGDKITISEDNEAHFTEKVILLPNQFQVNPSHRPESSKVPTRGQYGLPDSAFVFCCFNNTWKITPQIFEIWMHILHNVPQSVLWLANKQLKAMENLKSYAHQHQISPDRIIFADRVSEFSEHISRYRLADLFLDTFPYNAHTTASDALWAGLPVLTLQGSSFASRVASSLLQNSGLAQLITHSEAEYEKAAVALASRPDKLAELRSHLLGHRKSTPLFNTPLFARHLESVFQAMYDRYQAGLPPGKLIVEN